jgi:choline dehydrogenase-like flavoprotein
VPAGRLLGGSSALNGFAFLPNPKSNVNAWASLGNPGWDWPALFKSLERFSLAASTKNPAQSPLQITIPDEDTEWPQVWRETLGTLGFLVVPNPFTEGIQGSVMCGETIGLDKKRSYSAKAYLDDIVRSRSNLTIWSKVPVE